MAKTSVSGKNRILSRLSAADKALLQPDLEPVTLTLRQVLEVPNKPITHSYFITDGLASIIAVKLPRRPWSGKRWAANVATAGASRAAWRCTRC